jgi:dTDP-4-dehydrorhamnose reductase
MRILVTGVHGFLGRTLLGLREEIEWSGCGRGTAAVAGGPYYQIDWENSAAVVDLVAALRPDWVINTAALTNVDQCEEDRNLARKANLDLVDCLVLACRQADAGLVQLSTDYVFDGKSGPYTERDRPHPLSHYGRLKLDSERLVLGRLDRSIVVRTLWLYGYVPGVGSNFVTWALGALHQGESLRVFADQWGNPTYVHDLARILVELCRRDARGLLHMGGATFMTRYELVHDLARFFDLDEGRVEPVSTAEAGLRAVRPLRSGLRTDALEAALRCRPMGFSEGLKHMRQQTAFRRDFAYL